jgi:hypothetical protein
MINSEADSSESYMTVTFNRNSEYLQTVTIKIMSYNDSFYLAEVNGEKGILLNKTDIKNLLNTLKACNFKPFCYNEGKRKEERTMLDKTVETLLDEQINKELYSAYLYLDFSVYYAEQGLDGFANWYKIQAQEERDHAMLFCNICRIIMARFI